MIETAVQKVIAEQFGLGSALVNLDVPLSEYDADSLDLLELVMALEDEVQIEIPDHAFDSFVFGNDMTKLTGRHLVDVATKAKG